MLRLADQAGRLHLVRHDDLAAPWAHVLEAQVGAPNPHGEAVLRVA